MTDSNQRFTVSKTDSLIGVYNINKGYAEFRQIKILYQNEEYAIVRPNTTYGLNVYDYIILDSSTYDKSQGKNAESGDSSSDSISSGSAVDVSIDASDEEITAEEGALEEGTEEISEEETGESLEESSAEDNSSEAVSE